MICNHIWNKNGTSKGVQRYRCRLCGARKSDALGIKPGPKPGKQKLRSKMVTHTQRFEKLSMRVGCDVSAEVQQNIDDQCFDKFPKSVIMDGDGQRLYLNIEEADRFSQAGYAIWDLKQGGVLKMKIRTLSQSPDWSTKNVGKCHSEMILRSDRQFIAINEKVKA